MDIEEVEDEASKVPTLIRTYGEYWNPELVDWRRSALLGKLAKSLNSPDLNFYAESGIYVLYKDYVPVYVGKAFRQSIGRRLQLHRDSRRKGPRWDSFSWFGLKGLKANRVPEKLNKRISATPAVLIETLEALLIVVIDPKLNSRREKLRGAKQIFQSLPNRTPDAEERLESIERKLDSLINEKK